MDASGPGAAIAATILGSRAKQRRPRQAHARRARTSPSHPRKQAPLRGRVADLLDHRRTSAGSLSQRVARSSPARLGHDPIPHLRSACADRYLGPGGWHLAGPRTRVKPTGQNAAAWRDASSGAPTGDLAAMILRAGRLGLPALSGLLRSRSAIAPASIDVPHPTGRTATHGTGFTPGPVGPVHGPKLRC